MIIFYLLALSCRTKAILFFFVPQAKGSSVRLLLRIYFVLAHFGATIAFWYTMQVGFPSPKRCCLHCRWCGSRCRRVYNTRMVLSIQRRCGCTLVQKALLPQTAALPLVAVFKLVTPWSTQRLLLLSHTRGPPLSPCKHAYKTRLSRESCFVRFAPTSDIHNKLVRGSLKQGRRGVKIFYPSARKWL